MHKEPVIFSLGVNGLLIGYFQLSLIHDYHFFFKLILELCLILFTFQLGAIGSEKSFEDYFLSEGGELIVFTISCLFLCSVASIFS